MGITLREVSNEADRSAVARLRYQVFVEEMGREPPGTDAASGQVLEPLDQWAEVLLALVDEGEVVAAISLLDPSHLPADHRLRTAFGLDLFPNDDARKALASGLAIRADHRDSDSARMLLENAYERLRERGVELLFLRSVPNLVALYEVLGFRRYPVPRDENDPALRLPMVMILGDQPHFETVKSPLLEVVRRHPPEAELGDWIERRFPEYARPSSVRALAPDEFMRSFAQRLNDPSIPLLDDLDGDEKGRLLAVADQRDVGEGQTVISQGETGRELMLLLDGAVEVSVTRHGRRRVLTTLGAGQIFGEGAFLMGTPRTADVVAIAPTLVLAVDTRAFDALSSNDPAVAVKVLRNLCRTLCLRLYGGVPD
jgi:CRP-like cAMP-binding protein/GNAT superfamily N-acetyltransferase